MNRLLKFLTAAVLCLPLLAQGQAKVGTAGLQFLKVGVCARAVGMGEAFTAVANDASALFYNPAGLIQMTYPEAGFSYIDYPAGLKFVNLGGIWPTPQINGVIGLQATSLYTDDMVETTPERPYGTGRTFNASDISLGLTYCQRLTQNFSVGASVKYLNERLADVSANGWAVDVGTFYATGWRRINIGMVIQNFGPDMKFVQTPFPLPINFKFGASMVVWESGMYNLLVAGEFIHPNDNLEVYVLGAELEVGKLIAFRMGKRMNAWQRDTWDEYQEDPQKDPFVEFPVLNEHGNICLDGFSMGLGLRLSEAGVTCDYAWSGLGTLGPVHRFTIGYKLNAWW